MVNSGKKISGKIYIDLVLKKWPFREIRVDFCAVKVSLKDLFASDLDCSCVWTLFHHNGLADVELHLFFTSSILYLSFFFFFFFSGREARGETEMG